MIFHVIGTYVATKPGEPFRLFPFGTIFKSGEKRVLDKAFAAKFRLPHFKPPIKLGSHDERTPAGGHIVGLEVREDGLYAVPEFTEAGLAALEAGSYRYQSPEVIWEGSLEDPKTGKLIAGPLIVGDALLHTPHLGEAAAMYSAETWEMVTSAADRLHAEIQKVQGEKSVTYTQAYNEVRASHPDLISAWQKEY